jgi:hypothetical protein
MNQSEKESSDGRCLSDPEETVLKLLAYCRANDWAGYDPYDALNSHLFSLPFLNTKIPRLVLTQAMKRSPINLRFLMLVPKTQNPKALALFLVSLLKLSKLDLVTENEQVRILIDRIIALRSPNIRYWCWGYSFPWQTRTILVPRNAPNLVCTTFVAMALLDAYEQLGNASFLEMALSAGDYLVKELYYTDSHGTASFSYPMPGFPTKVHNANLLAAALLSRLYHHTGDERLIGPALHVSRYSVGRQKNDGAWYYGELPNQNWIDNFHTGYNLNALRTIQRNSGVSEFEPHLRSGFEFYRKHFFRKDGAVRYYHNRTYPIDIHCIAQSLLTLLAFQDLYPSNIELARSTYNWAMEHMWDKAGFFYYRMLRVIPIRTSYMRWSQAWMLLALATLAEFERKETSPVREHQLVANAPA